MSGRRFHDRPRFGGGARKDDLSPGFPTGSERHRMLRVGVPVRFEGHSADAAAFLAEHMPPDLHPRQVLR